jgi:sec-independent protein translocase protein TatA
MGFLKGIGLPELLIILAVVLLLFGATRLPKLAGSMGKAIKEFRRETSSEEQPSRSARRRSRPKADSSKS